MGRRLGDAGRPAAGLGPLRREVLDARHDGDGPQHRPQRRAACTGLAARQAGRRAVRLGLLPAADPDVRQDRLRRRRARRSSTRSTTAKAAKGTDNDLDLDADDLRALVDDVQGDLRRPHRPRLPAGPARAAGPGRPRGLRLVERRPRPCSTAARSASRPTSAPRSTWWRWSSATSAPTPAPASRSPATRPPARSGVYGDYLPNAQGEDVVAGIRNTVPLDELEQLDKASLRRADAHHGDAGGPLPRPVRHRVHHRARQAVDAADPGRQAHRRRPRSSSPPSSSTRA